MQPAHVRGGLVGIEWEDKRFRHSVLDADEAEAGVDLVEGSADGDSAVEEGIPKWDRALKRGLGGMFLGWF